MEAEEFLTGYCRAADQSRMVTVEISGRSLQADCGFRRCPYAGECPVAGRIRAILAEHPDITTE